MIISGKIYINTIDEELMVNYLDKFDWAGIINIDGINSYKDLQDKYKTKSMLEWNAWYQDSTHKNNQLTETFKIYKAYVFSKIMKMFPHQPTTPILQMDPYVYAFMKPVCMDIRYFTLKNLNTEEKLNGLISNTPNIHKLHDLITTNPVKGYIDSIYMDYYNGSPRLFKFDQSGTYIEELYGHIEKIRTMGRLEYTTYINPIAYQMLISKQISLIFINFTQNHYSFLAHIIESVSPDKECIVNQHYPLSKYISTTFLNNVLDNEAVIDYINRTIQANYTKFNTLINTLQSNSSNPVSVNTFLDDDMLKILQTYDTNTDYSSSNWLSELYTRNIIANSPNEPYIIYNLTAILPYHSFEKYIHTQIADKFRQSLNVYKEVSTLNKTNVTDIFNLRLRYEYKPNPPYTNKNYKPANNTINKRK